MIFRVAIIEDDSNAAKTLSEMIKRYEDETHTNTFDLTCFSDAFSFLEKYQSDYDVIFLDIQMPGMNGIEAAKKIRKISEDVMLVFVTNNVQYAFESYEVHAYDYILKPVTYGNLYMKFKRICNGLEHKLNNVYITLNSRQGTKKLSVLDIIYIEVRNHGLVFYMKDGSFSLSGTLTEMEEKLSAYHFSRCNSCYLINLRYVTDIRGDTVIVSDNELKISRSKKQQFMREFAKFIGGSV